MKEVIFVGWINKGRPPVDGETTKNQYIIAELEKHCKVMVMDFYRKNRHPWIYLQAIWAMLSKPKAVIVLSTSARNIYSILKLFKALHVKREIIYWVVGGAFDKNVQKGVFQADVLNYVKYNLVQCHSMIDELERAGLTNVKYVSNFKPIKYYPDLEKAITERRSSGKIRFVFISRIMPGKGCDYLLDAIQLLNEKGLQHQFVVDFYGKIDGSYKDVFLQKVKKYENAAYYGLLDLRTNEGYDILASYHAMVFPTYWKGEGFAGVFIDAFIAGLPVLASDWAHNGEIITYDLGIIYPTHAVAALAGTMEKCILGEVDLEEMAKNARTEADKYRADNVITADFLRRIDLI